MDEILNMKINEIICRSENTDAVFDKLKAAVNQLKKDNKNLTMKLQDYNKDEEIRKREQEIKNIYDHSPIVLTDLESKAWKHFREYHYNKCGNDGHYIFDIYGTGIGNVIILKCPICDKEEDITDYDSW